MVERTLPLWAPSETNSLAKCGEARVQPVNSIRSRQNFTNVALSLFLFHLGFFVLPWFVISPISFPAAKNLEWPARDSRFRGVKLRPALFIGSELGPRARKSKK